LCFRGGPLSHGPRRCESDHRLPQVIANADTLGGLANFAKRRPRVLQIFRERFDTLICEWMPEELLENFEQHRADVWETYLLWLLGLVVC
jgi:hypothetical protein